MKANNIKILYIDDNNESLLVIKSMILKEFPEAIFLTALNGATGLKIAEEEDPDVILMDILMPNMDGYEVCKRLKANDKLVDIPIAFLTNVKGTNEIRIRAMEAGAAAYLEKPVEMKLLAIQINALLKVKAENVSKRNENKRLAFLVKERTSEILENHKATLSLLDDLKKENEARKNTEAALKASEELHRSVINASPDFIAVTDLLGNILFLSPPVFHLTGYDSTELLIGRNVLEFVASSHQQRIKDSLASMLNGTTLGVTEYHLLRADGSIIETEINSEFVRDENGTPTRVVYVIRDITKRKEVEKILLENEKKYRFITEKITDVVWLMDLKGKSIFVSQSVENFTGYTVEEYLAQNFNDRFTPESAQLAIDALRNEVLYFIKTDTLPNNYKKTLYFDYLCKNAEVKTGEVIVTPYFDDNKTLIGLHGVTRDVTQRKQMEVALRENEEMFRVISEQSPIAIELYNAEGLLIKVNKACLELFGVLDDKQLKGFSLFDDPNVSEIHKNEFKQGRSINYQSEFNFDLVKKLNLYQTTKSGKIYLDVIITPIKKQGLNEIGYLVQIQDITERIKAESKLKKVSNYYQQIIENAADGIVLIGANGEFKFISTSAKRILGYEDVDVITFRPNDLTHPDDLPIVLYNLDKLLKDHNLSPVLQYRFLNKKGEWIWVESKFTIQIDDENIVSIIINFRDITSPKKAEDALVQTRLNYETFFNTIHDFLFVLDLEGNIIHTNNTVSDRLLYSEEELLGKSVLDIHPADRRDEAGRIVGEMLSGITETCPVPIVTKTGVQIPVETRVTRGFWNGNPVLFGVTKDVSKVKFSEEKFSKVFHINPSACGLSDLTDHTYVEVNEAFYNLFGFDKDEVIGKTSTELGILNSEMIPRIESFANESGCIYNVEATLKTKNGNEKHVLLSSENINVQDKAYRFTVVQDITERKLAEKNLNHLARLYALLSEINKAIINHKNQDDLFETICNVAIEYGQFRMGWFGVYDEVSGTIIPKISAGFSNGYLETLKLDPSSQTNGKGPTGRAFNEGRIVFCNDIANDPIMQPWRDEAIVRGYLSSFAAPIFRNGKAYGTFTLYASEVGFFDEDEQKLLAEIGQNISFAIDAIDSEMERKQVLQELEINELKYRSLMENSPEGITIYVDGKIAYVNNEAMRMMKATDKEELMGKSIVDFIHPDNHELIFERMKYVAMAPMYAILPSVEEKYIRLDGKEIFVEIKVMPIMYDGKPAIQLSGHDITDRKKAEFALDDTMNELKAIYDSAPVMMCVVDEKADIQFANQAFAHLSELVIDDLKGGQVGDVLRCIHALEDNLGCGFGKLCGRCGLRGAMISTLNTGIGHSNIEHKSTLVREGKPVEVYLLASTALILTGETKRLLLCMVDITNRKKMEENLQLSEEKYRLLAENMHDGILSFDAQQRVNYVSLSYVKQLGYPEDYKINSGPEDIVKMIHPDDQKIVMAQLYEAIETKKTQLTYMFRVKHFLGHYIWREDSAKFNYDADGNYAGSYIICRDITSRKQIEEALQVSETRLHNLFEYAPISIWEEDLSLVKGYFDELKHNGIRDFRAYFSNNKEAIQKALGLINVIGVNETSLKVFGADSKDDIIEDLPLKVNDFNISVLQEEFIALAEGKTRFEGETQIITFKGEKKDLLLSLTVMPNYENSLSKVLISFIDITDRKQAEEALQKSEMFLRTFIDNSPFEIWARDINNVGILENKKIVDHFGSIIGKKPKEVTSQDKKIIKVWENNNKRILNGEIFDEVIDLAFNKKVLTYQQICFPIYNKLDIIGVAGFNIDITERRRAEEALRKSQVKLKQFAAHLQDVREEEKKLLAREIHDELGQILVALKIDLGLLRQKVFKKIENVDDEDVISKFNHLYGLVDDTIKTTRKIMTNLRPEVLDLLGFIDAVKQYTKEYQERHKINCQLLCNTNKIEINSQQAVALFRIVQESLTNVAKHAKATSVLIRLDAENNKLVMEIVDNGVGFDDTHKVRTDSYGMIGMKERVFLLDGELSIVGKVGEGTSVKVSIPYKEI